MITTRTQKLTHALEELYNEKSSELLFHGWHHIYLAAKKVVEFADELKVDKEIAVATALVHDLNYVVEVNSEPDIAKDLRAQYLRAADFTEVEIETIEQAIMESHTANRHAHISDLAKALADADNIFKVLPVTPMLFSSHYITENKVDIHKWAGKIIRDQKPLLDQDIYFYTKIAKQRYDEWARVNLRLVEMVQDALEDPDIVETLEIARRLKVI